MKSANKVVYTPSGPRYEGTSGAFFTTRLMWRELKSARELIWRLFVRDFSALYRQSVLGVAWAFIMPLVAVGLFVGMSSAGILNVGDVDMPYPLYAIIGITIWNFFTTGLTKASGAVVSGAAMITKINFPMVALVFSATGQTLVDFLIRVVLIAIIFMYYGIIPGVGGVLLAVLCLVPIYLMMVGLGMFLSIAAGVVRDVANILNYLFMVLMFLTPVVYPIEGDGVLARANVYNPFNYFVNLPRDLIVEGHSDMVGGFLIASAISLFVFYSGWRFFYLAQTKVAERI